MEKRKFDEWLSTFIDSISDYKYYIDFNKVKENVDRIKIELNILNSLVGSQDIENDFRKIITKYPEVLKCVPILLAVRQCEIKVVDEKGSFSYNFVKKNQSIEQYIYFMKETGLFYLLKNQILSNLVDYVTGVETGLDSNGRKNRGGHLMEDIVETYIKELNVTYYKEMYAKDIEKKWGLDLSLVVNNGKGSKRFDFVIETNKQIFVIETNFYSSGGSKLNETARSYKMLNEEINNTKGITFIWITDGNGWKDAKKNLRETFDSMEYVLNLNDLSKGVLNRLILRSYN